LIQFCSFTLNGILMASIGNQWKSLFAHENAIQKWRNGQSVSSASKAAIFKK
jgi:hypothetical protein